MAQSFFFYDLETSGINPREARVMQFAGQRTDMQLNPIGEPYNILVKLADDVLPEPDAILITGITPQKTLADGISEADFFAKFATEIATEDTIFVGYNNVRFDDEFMRFGLFRNFFDPYEWQWKDGRSRWDLLDVVRMTRALRPEGIKWPFASDGKPSNRLELLTSINGLSHEAAHDALSDVVATINVAQLIMQKQPKLFDYLLGMRSKREVAKLVDSGQPFVYVSGRYDSENEKMTVVSKLGDRPGRDGGALVYDLRSEPSKYIEMSAEQLAEAWRFKKEDEAGDRLPVKIIQYNRCPAVAPMNVLRPEDQKRLKIDNKQISLNKKTLDEHPEFIAKLHKALEILESDRPQVSLIVDSQTVDSSLYNSFIGDGDKRLFADLHETSPSGISTFVNSFKDSRLKALVPLYKGRNFSSALSNEERKEWEQYRKTRLTTTMPRFLERIQKISQRESLTANDQYLLEELHLYAESIYPED